MRKLVSKSLLITAFLVGAGLFFAPHHAMAGILECGTDFSCYIIGSTDIIYGIIGRVFWWVLIPLGGLILQLLGAVIDSAVSISLSPDFYNSPAIGIAWSVVRDLANMLFIFVLIYEGIKTILSIGNMASVKRTIGSVIVAALLLNFSLFFTKAMIDVSNLGTAWFVQGITRLGDGTSMSQAVHSTLQMEKLTRSSGGTLATALKTTTFSLQSFTQGVFLFALICVAIYVFFQMTFLIIGRIVAFIFLLITAPIGFTGVFLSLGDYSTLASKWWKEMLNQLMMLPMFFLMLYLTLFMVDRFEALFFSDDALSMDFTPVNYVIFIIIIMMLLKALAVAKEYSGELGGMVAKTAKGALSFAGGSFAMGTIGKAARVMGNNATVQKWAAGGSEGAIGKTTGAMFGRMTLTGIKGTANAGFGVKSGLKEAGLDKAPIIGGQFKGAEKGYEGKIGQEKKETEAFMKNLGKDIDGAKNRQSYAKSQTNTLYNRVVTNKATTMGAGAAVGAGIGSIAGPVGTVIGAGIGAGIGALNKKANPISGVMRDQEFVESGAEGGKKADKEYKKEAGAIAKKASSELENTPNVKQTRENLEKIKEELKVSEIAIKRLETLHEQETNLIVSLNKFNEVNKIDGKSVDAKTYTERLKQTQEQLKKTKDSVAVNTQLAEAKPRLVAEVDSKQKELTANREAVLNSNEYKDKLKKLTNMNYGSGSWDKLQNIAKEGDEVSAQEDSAKVAKFMEAVNKPADAPAPEPKGDAAGGDKH